MDFKFEELTHGRAPRAAERGRRPLDEGFLVGFGVPRVDAVPFIEGTAAPKPATIPPAPSE